MEHTPDNTWLTGLGDHDLETRAANLEALRGSLPDLRGYRRPVTAAELALQVLIGEPPLPLPRDHLHDTVKRALGEVLDERDAVVSTPPAPGQGRAADRDPTTRIGITRAAVILDCKPRTLRRRIQGAPPDLRPHALRPESARPGWYWESEDEVLEWERRRTAPPERPQPPPVQAAAGEPTPGEPEAAREESGSRSRGQKRSDRRARKPNRASKPTRRRVIKGGAAKL